MLTPFDGLSRPAPEAVARHFDRGDLLVRAGEMARTVYLLRRGQVRVFRLREDGHETVTAVLGRSHIVGIAAVAGNSRQSAFVDALSPVDAWAIPARALLEQLPRGGILPGVVIGSLAQRLALGEALVRGVVLPVGERVRDVERRLLASPGVAGARLRQTTLAGLAGATPETVSRLRDHAPVAGADGSSVAAAGPAQVRLVDTFGDRPGWRRIEPGTVVHEGRHPGRVCVIVEGAVQLVGRGPGRPGPGGREVLVAELGPGDLLEVGDLLGHPPSGLLGVARTPARVREVAAADLLRLLAGDPDRLARLLRRLAERLLAIEDRLARLSALTARERLERLLSDLAGDGVDVPSGLTHEVLARRVGARRETVTRVLAGLARTGHLP